MKRSLEPEPLPEEPSPSPPGEKRARPATTDVKDSDVRVMREVRDRYAEAGQKVNEELKRAKESFLMSYLKKTVEKIPASSHCIDVSDSAYEGYEGFLRLFSYAKMIVQQQFQMSNMMAFNSVFDTVTSLVGRGLHDRFVTPYVSGYVSTEQLDEAFGAYQAALADDDQKASTELHCITYIIQSELEKEKPLEIPNPVFNRFTQQMKAVSQYVTSILKGLTVRSILLRPVKIEREPPLPSPRPPPGPSISGSESEEDVEFVMHQGAAEKGDL